MKKWREYASYIPELSSAALSLSLAKDTGHSKTEEGAHVFLSAYALFAMMYSGFSYFSKTNATLKAFLRCHCPRLGMAELVTASSFYLWSYGNVALFSEGDHYDHVDAGELLAAPIITLMILRLTAQFKSKVESTVTKARLKSISSIKQYLVEQACISGALHVDIKVVRVGDRVVVSKDELIPVDGVVVAEAGQRVEATRVSNILGIGDGIRERTLRVGDRVWAGMRLKSEGDIEIRATANGLDSQLRKIVTSFNEGDQGYIETVDRVMSFYVPVVAFVSLVAGLVNYASSLDAPMSLYAVGMVWAGACPCAFALSVLPLDLMRYLLYQSNQQILLNRPDAILKTGNNTCVVFDKNGTLDEISVTSIEMLKGEGYSEADILFYAASVEDADHPIGAAIIEYAQSEDVSLSRDVERIESTGYLKGVSGCVRNSHSVYVGHLDFIRQNLPPDQTIGIKDSSLIFVAINSEDRWAIGSIRLHESLKPEASVLVSSLNRVGIQSYIMTGASDVNKQGLSESLGVPIDNIYTNLSPIGKSDHIERLKKSGCKVIYVGDGVNDREALESSDFGIAVSDHMFPASDVLLSKGLSGLIQLLAVSNGVVPIVKENLYFSGIYNLGMMASNGFILPLSNNMMPPYLPGILMALSSFIVAANSWRTNVICTDVEDIDESAGEIKDVEAPLMPHQTYWSSRLKSGFRLSSFQLGDLICQRPSSDSDDVATDYIDQGVHFVVSGTTCSVCVNTVRAAVSHELIQIRADHEISQCYRDSKTDQTHIHIVGDVGVYIDAVKNAIESAGFDVASFHFISTSIDEETYLPGSFNLK